MSSRKRAFLVSLAAVTALTATGTLVGLATGPAAYAASTAGGRITRSEVLSRAQSWVDENVPYNQSGYKSDANGTYREDCSGYVSMAWHLTDSLVTWTLPDVSSQISFSSLKPGDALDYTAEHTFLFAGWKDQSSGSFTYYAESNEHDPTHGPTSANINNSSLEGWPTSVYEGLRYNNIADDAPPPVTLTHSATGDFNGDGKADLVGIDSNNTMWLYPGTGVAGKFGARIEMYGGTSWKDVKGLAVGDFNGDGKADVMAIWSDGSLHLYSGNGDGTINAAGGALYGGTTWGTVQGLTAGDFNGDG
ncbi:VCBS repeat-containing protein, partial [Streptomyces sp. NPDC047017]|uniref:FG-GAP repeat domain-containing protein n=1 Tax=Streptomyces sp. NPDC047017 TaxID=3155024 RepID=UPI0033FF7D0B